VRVPQTVPVAMPQIKGVIVLKVDLGRGDSPREEDITVDEDEGDDREDECSKSELTEPPEMPKPKPLRGNTKNPRTV